MRDSIFIKKDYPEKSDVKGVIKVFNFFLEMNIKTYKMIDPKLMISHPYFSSSHFITNYTDYNIYDLIKQEDFNKAVNYVKEVTTEYMENIMSNDDPKNASRIVTHCIMNITKPYRTSFFKMIFPYLSKADIGENLRFVWKTCDYVNVDTSISKDSYMYLFDQFRDLIMEESDKCEYDRIMKFDTISIYRGSNSITKNPELNALSYTTSYETALSFANNTIDRKRNAKKSIVTIEIHPHPDWFLCYMEDEHEVVVNYRKMKKYIHKQDLYIISNNLKGE